MLNPIEAWRQRRARRTYMPVPKRSRLTRTAAIGFLALLLLAVVAMLLQLRRGSGAETDLIEFATSRPENALELIETAASAHRLVFVSDVPSAGAPKRFIQQAIERISAASGLDLVVLDVDAEEQPYIDSYLATVPEDASILLARPRAIREAEGVSRTFIEIYRTVWRVNQQLGAARRIRIVAADAPGWPPDRATSPADAVRLFGQRTDYMMKHVMERSLSRDPKARVLFFVDGLYVLKSGEGRVNTGGAEPLATTWLAARMREYFPADVYSILVDATPSRSVNADVVVYRGTDFGDVFRRGRVPAGTALHFGDLFDAVSRSPIRTAGTTGINFTLEPRNAPALQFADAYIYFGN